MEEREKLCCGSRSFMNVLKPFQFAPLFASLLNFLTLLVCYLMTIEYKHLQNDMHGWLLRCSVIGNYFPESILYTIGLSLCGVLYAISVLLRRRQIQENIICLEEHHYMIIKCSRRLSFCNEVATAFGFAGCMMFLLVGIRVHLPSIAIWEDVFPALTFAFFIIHMAMNTRLCYPLRKRKSFLQQLFVFIAAFLSFIGMIFSYIFSSNLRVSSAASTLEYCVNICIMVYFFMYFTEFRTSSFMLLDRTMENHGPGLQIQKQNPPDSSSA